MTVDLDEVQQESIISAAFRAVLSALNTLAAGVKVVLLGPGHSMSVLIVCETLTGLRNLVSLNVSGELKSRLEELCTRLLIASADDPQTITPVRINKVVWRLTDYYRCYRYFSASAKCELLSNGLLKC